MNALRRSFAALPAGVGVLGLVSLLMDLSSEAIHSLLPLFMLNVLSLSALTIGMLDAAAEALTLALKPLSGWLSDRWRQRKPLTLFGYGLSAVSKPLFALAGGLPLLLCARLLDRSGKGLRGAPRDALIADLTTPDQRGAAYGLRQSLDTIGALLAPVLAAALLWWWQDDYRAVFWVASVPAFAAVLLLWLRIKEAGPAHYHEDKQHHQPIPTPPISQLLRTLWPIYLLAMCFTLARPSEAFLILRGQTLGLSPYEAPLLLAVMNLVYALSAFPLGHLSDRLRPGQLLHAGAASLLLSTVLLTLSEQRLGLYLAAACWGLHLGCFQGLLTTLISKRAPAARRALAFGLYALCVGISLLINGALVGYLWDHSGPAIALLLCCALTTTAWLFLFISEKRWLSIRPNGPTLT